jgi:hypothetical protein
MRLVSYYAYGSSPDEVIARLVSSASEDGRQMTAGDAKELVLIARLMVRLSTLGYSRSERLGGRLTSMSLKGWSASTRRIRASANAVPRARR